jgi:hypothetical protein
MLWKQLALLLAIWCYSGVANGFREVTAFDEDAALVEVRLGMIGWRVIVLTLDLTADLSLFVWNHNELKL